MAILIGETGIVRKFFKVSLSRSMKNNIAAMIPKTAGSIIGIPIVASKPKTASKPVKFPTLPASTRAVNGIGNKSAAKTTNDTKCFRFNFRISHWISLSNPLTPCNSLEVILQRILAEMGFLNINASLHKRTVYLCHRQGRVVEI